MRGRGWSKNSRAVPRPTWVTLATRERTAAPTTKMDPFRNRRDLAVVVVGRSVGRVAPWNHRLCSARPDFNLNVVRSGPFLRSGNWCAPFSSPLSSLPPFLSSISCAPLLPSFSSIFRALCSRLRGRRWRRREGAPLRRREFLRYWSVCPPLPSLVKRVSVAVDFLETMRRSSLVSAIYAPIFRTNFPPFLSLETNGSR